MADNLEQKIAARYRQASNELPRPFVDQMVLKAARTAVEQQSAAPFGNQWLAGAAMAAVVVLSVVLVSIMPQEQAFEPGPARAPALTGETYQEALDADAETPASAAEAVRGVETERVFKRVAPKAVAPAPSVEQEFMRQPQGAASSAEPRLESYDAAPQLAPLDVEMEPAMRQRKAAVATGEYYLQAGSYRSESNAHKQQARIITLGYLAELSVVTRANGDTFYRVHVGPFASPASQGRARQALAAQGIDSSLLRIPPAE